MTLPISSLANMEYMLYGGALGANPNCPSYVNGYKAENNNLYGGYYNPSIYYNNPYYNWQNTGYYNPGGQNEKVNNSIYNSSVANANSPSGKTVSNTSAINPKDIDVLADYYKDTNTYVQKWGGLFSSAMMIGFTENPQTFKHPFNSIKAFKLTNQVFDKSNPAIKALWEKNPMLMQKAYGQLHAINRNAQTKWKWLGQGAFQKPISDAARKDLEKIMADAIKSGDEKAILRATETLKASRGMDGYIPTAWNKIRNFFGGNAQNYTPQERIARKAADIEKAVNAPAAVKPGVTGLLKQGVKEGKNFALLGMLIDLPKFISAYKNGGTESVLTQAVQTGSKAIADGIGWTIGRAAGTAIGAKAGALLGTAICPGVGTAVGAALGFLGGAAGSILASKVMKLIIPTDEATKLEAEAQKKTPEGQAQLLSLVLQNVQAGEKVPEKVLASAQNVAAAMSA